MQVAQKQMKKTKQDNPTEKQSETKTEIRYVQILIIVWIPMQNQPSLYWMDF